MIPLDVAVAAPDLARLGIDAERWTALHPETRAVVRRACLDKVPWGRDSDRSAAERIRQGGEVVSAYRCPFADPVHWHVGHPLSVAGMETTARAIRDLHGDRPGVVVPIR